MENSTNEKKKFNDLFANVAEKTAELGKKGAEMAKTTAVQAADKGKLFADELSKGAKQFSEQSKIDAYNRRMKQYNPLFPEEYFSDTFFVPNIIRIVDDAVRRDVDVCQGAIGWRENKKGTEVLFLYDEFVNECGLYFVPAPICDEFYYMDPRDKKRFIKIDMIFQRTHEEKIAELEHIAYCLGAKVCTIEIEDAEITHDRTKANVGVNAKVKGSASADISADSSAKCTSKNVTRFKGNDEITMPRLKWFSNDDGIRNLIEFRTNGGNAIESKTLELRGSTSATMSQNAAASVDAAVASVGVKSNFSMESKSAKENSQTIIYHLEF